MSMRVDTKPDGSIVLYVDAQSLTVLRRALDDAERGNTATIGDGPFFMVKPAPPEGESDE